MSTSDPDRIVTLLGVPFDAASSFLRGASAAPAAIRDALASPAGNMWAEDFTDLTARLEDAGDVRPAGHEPDAAAWRDAIERRMRDLDASRARVIALGGDHSVTYPLVRGLGPDTDTTIVHVDAHPDLYPDFDGDRYSHACPFARILEEGLVRRVVQVGIRASNAVQREQAERYGVEVISAAEWASGRRPEVFGAVYLSIDLDAFDPAFAPGVSHPEPGGLSTRDVIGLVQRLAGTVIGADIVELNPARDVNGVTARVAAKLVKEVAAAMLRA